MIKSFLILILAYLLGSFPSGYIITLFSTGRDILKVGWKKTSGSNVFKNIGFWQGVLTGLLDVGKGCLAVIIAKDLDAPIQIQILSGVAAITGHNWSFFLKLAGGRGIGTFIGAFLILSPEILKLSLIFLICIGIIWNLAIGTIIFLLTSIIFSIYFRQLETTGLFTVLSLFPIFLKRLSPIEELKKATNGTTLIKNRLFFDDDISYDLRIKKIMKRLTKR